MNTIVLSPVWKPFTVPQSLKNPIPQASVFPNLPTEILIQIFEQCTLVSQITLALTCKRLFFIAGTMTLKFARIVGVVRELTTEGMDILVAVHPRSPTRSHGPHSAWHICTLCFRLRPTSLGYWEQKKPADLLGFKWDNWAKEFSTKRSSSCPGCGFSFGF